MANEGTINQLMETTKINKHVKLFKRYIILCTGRNSAK